MFLYVQLCMCVCLSASSLAWVPIHVCESLSASVSLYVSVSALCVCGGCGFVHYCISMWKVVGDIYLKLIWRVVLPTITVRG